VVADVVGYFHPLALRFGAAVLEPASAAATTDLLSPVEVTFPPISVTTCVVTCSVTVTSAAANVTGSASVRGGYHFSGLSDFGGPPMAVAPVAVPGGSSATQSVETAGLVGGGRVRFGCQVSASGDFLGDEITGTVAWICR
jgi:hypothetical protein